MSNLEKIYETEIKIAKEKLKLLKEEKTERTLFNIADFLINKAVPIINIIDVINQIKERGEKKLKEWFEIV